MQCRHWNLNSELFIVDLYPSILLFQCYCPACYGLRCHTILVLCLDKESYSVREKILDPFLESGESFESHFGNLENILPHFPKLSSRYPRSPECDLEEVECEDTHTWINSERQGNAQSTAGLTSS